MKTKFDSPALIEQSNGYPASWHGKVPCRVRMDKTVRSDLPSFDSKRFCAVVGQEYDAYVNCHGALCAIFDDGEMLGLKPYEFTVVAWHEAEQPLAPDGAAPTYTRDNSGNITFLDEGKEVAPRR